jgi:hypothetical protein
VLKKVSQESGAGGVADGREGYKASITMTICIVCG